MSQPPSIDGVLIRWGDRLFYPGNHIVKTPPQPKLRNRGKDRAAELRARMEATVLRRAPQVMVKVTGGGRGMKAIAAHFRYISKNGRLEIEDERGQVSHGREAVTELAEDWRFGGSLIEETSDRREAYNLMLSMPRGVDPLILQRAAREFASEELADYKYVMVLHDHQANPHVHISVRAESKHGKRLNPRKADLHRWRETFAEKLQGWGVDAEATRQATRGDVRRYPPLWRVKAKEEGRERVSPQAMPARRTLGRLGALEAWGNLAMALEASGDERDNQLARGIARFVKYIPRQSSQQERATAQDQLKPRDVGPTR
ncbi:MAG: conjugal transfer protein TraS [Caldimonas sp.]